MWNETLTMRRSKRVIRGRGVVTVSLWIVLTATTAMAQQSAGTAAETVTTRRDVNGRDVVIEKVVTHRDRTDNDERVVIETSCRRSMRSASR